MSVCLHCGELGPAGALFCAKCGYTLPQADHSAAGAVAAPPPGFRSLSPVAPPPPPPPPPPPLQATVTPATPMVGWAPGPAPPSGKHCNRCGTLIARAAVYCPVCQQPQLD